MSDATLEARVLAALRHGPLYEGLIPVIVNSRPPAVYHALRYLQETGQVERDGYTWSVKA